MSGHPTSEISDVTHQRVRLGILSLLSSEPQLEFSRLREELGVTDGNLSRHLDVLERAGDVHLRKVIDGRRPKTWIAITRVGRKALRREIQLLRMVIAQTSARI